MTENSPTTRELSDLDHSQRYSRQIRFVGIGNEGQVQLSKAKVFLCGCGALGTALAETLTRAGVGTLRIVDRDFVDLSNLQRQVLFDEQDVRDHLPKSIVAARKLAQINSRISIEPIVADVGHKNIRDFVHDVDLMLDGTDNFETRFLINDLSLETGIPWVYAGCVGSRGQTMPIFPHQTACLRCLIDTPPEPGATETCDTAGVLATAIQMVTSIQATTALKILAGRRDLVRTELTIVDVWDSSLRQVDLTQLRERSRCPACVEGRRDWLHGRHTSQSTVLCGRNSVQISPAFPGTLPLDQLAISLAQFGTVTGNPFLIRLALTDPDYEITVFRDGRAIIQGTDNPSIARGLYARFIGA